MLLRDDLIRRFCQYGNMITPFLEGTRGGGLISYGLSGAGYDIRLSDKILVFKNTHNLPIDPKQFFDEEYRSKLFDEVSPSFGVRGYHFTIPPHSYILGMSIEKFDMPKNVLGVCVGKSTLARCGIIVNITPLEPGWKGYLTIEVSNSTPAPAVVYTGEGIAQILFFQLDKDVEKGYGEKGGAYQNQVGVTPAKVVM